MKMAEPAVQKAIVRVNRRLRENPSAAIDMLIDEASREYGLSPLDGEFLYRHFSKQKTAQA